MYTIINFKYGLKMSWSEVLNEQLKRHYISFVMNKCNNGCCFVMIFFIIIKLDSLES